MSEVTHLFDPLCGRTPEQIPEYSPESTGEEVSATEYVRAEEGSLDRRTGQFLCTDCYIKHGMPSGPRGWTATTENLKTLLLGD